jgi:hypothetical protein
MRITSTKSSREGIERPGILAGMNEIIAVVEVAE